MQFLIIAYDAEDESALDRRMKAREAHVAHIDKARASGQAIIGAAILDETSGKMGGSCIIAEFPDRNALEAWIDSDPYMEHEVWGNVYIQPCAVGPSFTKR